MIDLNEVSPNYSEEQILQILEKTARTLAKKFKFGYYDEDDIVQEAILIALQALPSYDNSRPLENFIWVCMHNGLYNLKRSKYFRPTPPCTQCPLGGTLHAGGESCTEFSSVTQCKWYVRWVERNNTRKHLMSACVAEEDFCGVFDTDDPAANELFSMVDRRIPPDLREAWLRFVHGNRITHAKRQKLLSTIRDILEDA